MSCRASPGSTGDLDAELPAITQLTLSVSFWLRDHYLFLFGALLVSGVVASNWSKTPPGRLFFDRLRLRIPIVGEIFRYFSLSEFCRSLSTLLAGGIPLVSALGTAVNAVGNRHVATAIEPVIDEVRQGQAFNEALEPNGVFFPIWRST